MNQPNPVRNRRPPFKHERRTVKPGQIMYFMEVPTGFPYWHLREEGGFIKRGNSHSEGADGTVVIHGLFDSVKVLPQGWIKDVA